MRKILLWATIGCVVILLLAVGISQWQSHTRAHGARVVADAFVKDVLAGNDTGSYGLYTSATQQSLDKDTWSIQVIRLRGFFYGQAPAFASEHPLTAGNYAVDYSINGEDGTYTLEVTMAPVQKGWQVQYFTNTLNS